MANQDRAGPILSSSKHWVMTENPLTESPNLLPEPAAQLVFFFKSLWCPVSATTRTPDVRKRQKGADVAGHPIVGVGHMVEKLEVVLFVELAGSEVGSDLPNPIIELVGSLEAE